MDAIIIFFGGTPVKFAALISKETPMKYTPYFIGQVFNPG